MFTFDDLNDSRISAKRFDIHLYADYAELLCLAHIDSFVTRSTFFSFLEKREFFESVEGQSVDNDLPTEVFQEDPEDDPYRDDDYDVDEEEGDLYSLIEKSDLRRNQHSDRIERDSLREGWLSDIFEHLRCRWLLIHEDSYPFRAAEDAELLTLKSDLTVRQKTYIFFLLCANLNLFKKGQATLTTVFESVSEIVFKKLVPPGSEVHIFGKGGVSSPMFTGNKKTKLGKLAKCLNTELFSDLKFAATDNGDAGLDLVGWLPTGDICNGMLVFFGQCGCGKTWNIKQDEVMPPKWHQYFLLKHPNAHITFVPYYLRDADGNWHQPQEIRGFTVDRARFFHYLKNEESETLSTTITSIDRLLESKISFG